MYNELKILKYFGDLEDLKFALGQVTNDVKYVKQTGAKTKFNET